MSESVPDKNRTVELAVLTLVNTISSLQNILHNNFSIKFVAYFFSQIYFLLSCGKKATSKKTKWSYVRDGDPLLGV